MTWIDYKKAYDMVLQSWIIDCLKIYEIPDKVITFITEAMKNWKVELTAREKKFSWEENTGMHLLERCTFTIIIYKSDDVTQSHT